jgi:hypothetical protein
VPSTTVALDQVLGLVDAALEGLYGRGALSAADVTDLLLDLRTSLVETAELEDTLLAGEPALH